MPQAPSAISTKGVAMHAAISAVWMETDRSPENIEKVMKEHISRILEESFLLPNEKQVIGDRLAEDAPVVARALATHFGTRGTIYTEKWMKAAYGHVTNGEHITVPIHGRLDAIIDEGESVAVFDYKTRQAMSENEIRGKTKDSDGSYFRQLAFYKLLIESDRRYRGRRGEYSLVFVSPDGKGRCPIVTLPILAEDVQSLETKIRSLIDAVWSGEIVKQSCGNKDCQYCSWRSVLKD